MKTLQIEVDIKEGCLPIALVPVGECLKTIDLVEMDIVARWPLIGLSLPDIKQRYCQIQGLGRTKNAVQICLQPGGRLDHKKS